MVPQVCSRLASIVLSQVRACARRQGCRPVGSRVWTPCEGARALAAVEQADDLVDAVSPMICFTKEDVAASCCI